MLDHVSINVGDFDTTRAFYAAALEPLGIAPVMEFPGFCGFGEGQKPYFWIGDAATDDAAQHRLRSPSPRPSSPHTSGAGGGLGVTTASPGCATTTSITTARSCSTPTRQCRGRLPLPRGLTPPRR